MDISKVIDDIKDKFTVDNIVDVMKDVKIIDDETITEQYVRDTLNKTIEYVEDSKRQIEENKDFQELLVAGKALIHDTVAKVDEARKDIDFQEIAKQSKERLQEIATKSEEKLAEITEKWEKSDVSNVLATAKPEAKEVITKLKEITSQAKHKINELAKQSIDKLNDFKEQVFSQSGSVYESTQQSMKDLSVFKSLINSEARIKDDETTNDLDVSILDSGIND